MNELSTEVKAQEIHENAQFWHNRAEHNLYKFFLEVKKIRDNRYYKELGYSNFEDYCLNSWNIKRGTMDERIQIAETFSESDFNRYSGQLGHKKTLLLTTMSELQRLKHVKENDLAHGEWSNWLKSVNLNRTQATKFIKVSEEFSDDSTWNQIGLSAMYMIATLPEEERTIEHKTSNGSQNNS